MLFLLPGHNSPNLIHYAPRPLGEWIPRRTFVHSGLFFVITTHLPPSDQERSNAHCHEQTKRIDQPKDEADDAKSKTDHLESQCSCWRKDQDRCDDPSLLATKPVGVHVTSFLSVVW